MRAIAQRRQGRFQVEGVVEAIPVKRDDVADESIGRLVKDTHAHRQSRIDTVSLSLDRAAHDTFNQIALTEEKDDDDGH